MEQTLGLERNAERVSYLWGSSLIRGLKYKRHSRLYLLTTPRVLYQQLYETSVSEALYSELHAEQLVYCLN